jgi:hypothetical protein
MVSPDWFFSTLAQATAASIGFILAFVAALYGARKSQTANRKFRLMDHLQEVEEEFDPTIEAMSDHLAAKGGFPVAGNIISQMKVIERDQDELEKMAQNFQNPTAVKLYANLIRTQKILDLIVTPQPNRTKEEYLQYLNFTTTEMSETVGKAKNALVLFAELTDEDSDPDDPARKAIFPLIEETENWLEQNFINEGGNTLAGWKHILNELNHQTRRGGAMAQGSDIVVTFEEYQHVLDRIMVLFFIGVVFPMTFLLAELPTWWPEISGLTLTAVEILFLIAISWNTFKLIGAVSTLIDAESNIG